MRRLPRLLSVCLILTTLLTSLPAVPVQAMPNLPATVEPRTPAALTSVPPKRPGDARSTGYTPAEAEQAIAAGGYDNYVPSSGGGVFDGTFDQRPARVLLNTNPIVTLTGSSSRAHQAPPASAYTIITPPRGTQSMVASVAAYSNVQGNVTTAMLYTRAAGTTSWSVELDLAVAANDDPIPAQEKYVQLHGAGTTEPFEILLLCYSSYNSVSSSCTWTDIKFYQDVPGWTRKTGSTANTLKTRWGVRNTVQGNVGPLNGSNYLAVERLGSAGGGSGYTSPALALPPFGAGMLKLKIRWKAPTVGSNGVNVKVQGATTSDYMNMSLAAPADWTTEEKSLPTTLSNKVVNLTFSVEHSGSDPLSVSGIDDIKFFYGIAPNEKELIMPIVADSTVGECSCTVMGGRQYYFGDPVNTFSGAFVLDELDAALPTDGASFDVRRSYASLFADTAKYPVTSMGAGWRNSFQEVLTLPTSVYGEPQTIIFEAATGNRVRFFQSGPTTFKPGPGVRATLVLVSGQYILTHADQTKMTFDTFGRLLTTDDPQGRRLVHAYNGPSGYKDRITHNATGRNLRFIYTDIGSMKRLQQVDLYSNATTGFVKTLVIYTYDANGLLIQTNVQPSDATPQITRYGYDATSRRLTQVWRGAVAYPADPGVVPMVENTYYPDTYTEVHQRGKIDIQTEASGRSIKYSYEWNPGAASAYVTTMNVFPSDGGAATVVRHHYRADGMPRMQEQNGQFLNYQSVGASFSPRVIMDGNLRATLIDSNPAGLPTKITAANGGITTAIYDTGNRPTQIVQADGVKTTNTYNTAGNLTRSEVLGTTGGTPLVSEWTYTPTGRLETAKGPDGVITYYHYNAQYQMDYTIQGYTTPNATKTTYTYDGFGRITDITVGADTMLASTTHTDYQTDGQPIKVIQNYVAPGVYNSTIPQNVWTAYGYDGQGRHLWTKTVDGRYHGVTHYNAAGQVDWTVENPVDSAGNPVDPTVYPTIKPAYSPTRPDANILTEYGYDGLGHQISVVQHGIGAGTFQLPTRTWSTATTRRTETFYDGQHQPIKLIQINPAPGVDSVTEQFYDGAGNVIWASDPGGRWAKYGYDELSRPVTTTLNYENGNPQTVTDTPTERNWTWTDGTDTDLVSVIQYDAGGRVQRSIENYVDGVFDLVPTRPITDRITLMSYDSFGRTTGTTVNLAPTEPYIGGTNRTTMTAFETTTGRLSGIRDARGTWTVPQYDGVSRVKGSIRNCVNALGQQASGNCVGWTSSSPDRNVPGNETRYDTRWRVEDTVDPDGIVTRQSYNVMGQPLFHIRNYVANGPGNSITNVATSTSYNALGQVDLQMDEEDNPTFFTYNGLGQRITSRDPDGWETSMGYDGTGEQRWTRTPDGRFTVTTLDGLGRVSQTSVNYENGSVEPADGVDRDLITRTTYDLAGNVAQTIDPLGRVTAFSYDHMDRLIAVIENQVTTCAVAATDCNIETRYRYDRMGNRVAIIDMKGNVRRFEYNAADEQVAAIDALGQREEVRYDAGGFPIQKIFTRDGVAEEVFQSYDALGRPTSTTSMNLWFSDQTWTYDRLDRVTSFYDESAPAGTDGTLRYSYDPLSRVKDITDPRVGMTSYTYTPRSQRDIVTYPNRTTVVDYDYAAAGMLQAVSQGGREIASYDYDLARRVQTVRRNNSAIQTTYTYDAADRVRDMVTTSGGVQQARFQYTVDRGGQRTAVTDTVGNTSLTTSYTYDNLRRLTAASDSTGTTYGYEYDRAGNRTVARCQCQQKYSLCANLKCPLVAKNPVP